MARIGSFGVSADLGWDESENVLKVATLIWDTGSLAWIKATAVAGGPTSNVAVTNFPATQAITAAALPLPVGAATAALQTALSAQLPAALGAKTIATSLGVNIASDQTVPVSGTFFQATQPVSAASLPLPSGAATSANQATEISSLASLDGKVTTTANGVKVDASAVTQPVSATSLPLPTGAATSALQTTISGQLPATLGAKTIANSMAVNIASDQTVPISLASLPSLATGSNLVGKVGIDQTTPGTTNGVQVNAALPTGTNSIGQTTSNAGTNLNTSALALESGGNLDRATASLYLLEEMLLEMRAMRMAIVFLATEGGRCRPEDFNPQIQNLGTMGFVN